MSLDDVQIKEMIRNRWNVSSQKYDDHHGHGIKSVEEKEAWKELFAKNLPGGNLKVLDVGCGTGELSIILRDMGYRVTGLDLSEKMLAIAESKVRAVQGQESPDIDFRIGDAESPPFVDGKFDAIIARHVLWTLPNPIKAVTSWKRLLKNGGKLLVIDAVWNNTSLRSRFKKRASRLLIRIFEKRDLYENKYPDTLKATLPNDGGLPPERARKYLETVGLKNVKSEDLGYLTRIQKKYMPFLYKIGYTDEYFLACGEH